VTVDERYMSRKFILAAFLIVTAVPLLVWKVMTPEQYIEYMKWTLGLYMAGNVGTKVVTA
jgi:hypothetical protein